MTLTPGTRIGPFEIVSALGAGGMGEVYRAKDARLGREVAVKVLPAVFTSDPERLARFEREAQAVAALSHPNILSIHDFGREGAIAYAVMELLDGESLRARMASGPLPPRKAIDYGVQIAQGLASAHDKGIAHRDLKPDNVFITRDDRIKILDFGLAKALGPRATSATLANTVGTAEGTILGTVGYMAPEQVRGLDVDHRADIFAFGAVLYEMLTGRRAFPGDTAADAMSAVLNSEPPDVESITGGLAPAVERIVRRCLEKKPELRFQSARDLAFALDTLAHPSRVGSGASVAVPVSSRTGRALAFGIVPVTVAVLTAALTAGTAAYLFARNDAPDARWGQFQQVTDAAGEEVSPTISPDGTTVAYAMKTRGSWDIYAQRVGGRNQTAVIADADRHEKSPAFSPDGRFIAFHEGDADGGIFVVGATGEASRRLTDFGFHPAWSPDGSRIAFTTEEIVDPASRQNNSELWIATLAGGAPRRIAGTGDAAQPAWSPSGERIAYWSNTGGQRDLYTIPVGGGERRPIVEDGALDWSPVWMPDGRLLFASNRGGSMNLWRIAVEQSSGRPVGPPEPVTAGVQAALEQPSISHDGRRLVFRSRVAAVNPVALAFDADRLTTGPAVVLNNANTILMPTDVSPDGRWIAYYNQGAQREDLFISAADGSGLRRITDDEARDRNPVWIADGRSLLFQSNRGGRWEIWRIGRDGGNLQKLAGIPGDDVIYPLLAPDGKRLFVSSAANGLFAADLATIPAIPRRLDNTEFSGGVMNATWMSADGTKLVGPITTAGGTPIGVAVYDIAANASKQVSGDVTYSPVWLSDNRRVVYFTSDDELVVLDTVTRQRWTVNAQLPLKSFDTILALSRDDRRIVYPGNRSDSDIWIAERLEK